MYNIWYKTQRAQGDAQKPCNCIIEKNEQSEHNCYKKVTVASKYGNSNQTISEIISGHKCNIPCRPKIMGSNVFTVYDYTCLQDQSHHETPHNVTMTDLLWLEYVVCGSDVNGSWKYISGEEKDDDCCSTFLHYHLYSYPHCEGAGCVVIVVVTAIHVTFFLLNFFYIQNPRDSGAQEYENG